MSKPKSDDTETPKAGQNPPSNDETGSKAPPKDGTATTSPSDDGEQAARDQAQTYANEITRLIYEISGSTNRTDVKSVVDRYPRLLNPRLTSDGEGRFPVSMRPHRTPGRSMNTRKLSLIGFHIGDAVTAWYDYIERPVSGTEDRVVRAIKRLRVLHRTGYDALCVVGDDAKGYMLAPPQG